jgi:hypothetical protein
VVRLTLFGGRKAQRNLNGYSRALLCRIERRPPRLDIKNYPHLPPAQVRATQATDYMTLLDTASDTGATA